MNDDLVSVLRDLYDNEINASISCFWDAGWDVRLGDEMNGFKAEEKFSNDQLAEAIDWLKQQVEIHYPDSELAIRWQS